MKEAIDKIRAMLDELEQGLNSGETERVLRDFSKISGVALDLRIQRPLGDFLADRDPPP